MELVNRNGNRHLQGVDAEFFRIDGHSIELGVVVAYQLKGFNFQVLANRDSVQVLGEYPPVMREGIDALREVLRRAVLHHEHLKTFTIGEKQIPLDERVLMLNEIVNSAEVTQ